MGTCFVCQFIWLVHVCSDVIYMSLAYIWLLGCEFEYARLDIEVFAAFIYVEMCDDALLMIDTPSSTVVTVAAFAEYNPVWDIVSRK